TEFRTREKPPSESVFWFRRSTVGAGKNYPPMRFAEKPARPREGLVAKPSPCVGPRPADRYQAMQCIRTIRADCPARWKEGPASENLRRFRESQPPARSFVPREERLRS